jgi:radical SAM family uncharacterized protein
MFHRIEEFLPLVARPARYVGGEINRVCKEWESCDVRLALAFPETYEIGMSHIGLKILYYLINRLSCCLAERIFAPWPDMEAHMRAQDIPLYSLESFRPARDFDIVGFSLQYEMTYTNVLNMLDLAGLCVNRSDRSETDPLVIAGGPCTLNPEPMAAFVDAFVIGEAEEVIVKLLEQFRKLKKRGTSRQGVLDAWAQLEGVYVPSLYEVHYTDNRFAYITARSNAPEKVKRLWVKDLDSTDYPVNPPVPYIEPVHDRFAVEIMRGCTRGCRFCHAGMTYRPVRERRVETICRLVEEGLGATGYDAITLASLSSTDYSEIGPLISRLTRELSGRHVSISLPSLRLDSFSVGIARRIQEVRKSGFTFAPEAATDRLRRVINKDYAEEEMFRSLEDTLKSGWDVFKLYFMLGLPTETDGDVDAIAELILKIRAMGRRLRGKKFRTNVSLSAFVPKPHTPFQWEAMVDEASLKDKYKRITSRVRYRDVKISWREPALCLLEALLSRGDRRMGAFIHTAWKAGARFDGWDSELDIDAWHHAMAECGIDHAYVTRFDYSPKDSLPWDHIDTGVSKAFLRRERERARAAEFTADCRHECKGCGVCGHVDLSH